MTENEAHTSPVTGRYTLPPITKCFGPLCILVAAISAVTFIVLAIIGTIRDYSPVPTMDMWPGFLNFYLKATAGDWSAWWQAHVSHRIVLSRLFFWLDLRFFGGGGWFSLTITYLCISCVAALLSLIWLGQTRPQPSSNLEAGDYSRNTADCFLESVSEFKPSLSKPIHPGTTHAAGGTVFSASFRNG
jgi:hypothetical protein